MGGQPPASWGCTARKASLSDCPTAQPPPGTILVKSFPPGSHQGFHVRKPPGSPRQSPARPLWPSEPLCCPVQTHSVLRPSAVLTQPAAGTVPPSVQTRHCNSKNGTDDQLPKEPAPCTATGELQHPPTPSAQGHTSPGGQKPGQARGGLRGELECREQNPKPEPEPRCLGELSEHTPHFTL